MTATKTAWATVTGHAGKTAEATAGHEHILATDRVQVVSGGLWSKVHRITLLAQDWADVDAVEAGERFRIEVDGVGRWEVGDRIAPWPRGGAS